MGTPLPPPDTGAGLLAEYGLPEHAPVDQLRALARIAAAMCGAPTAVVNLLDDSCQHQVGEVGFVGGRTPVSSSMCALALTRPRLRYVPDASLEPAFAGNPWVDGRLAAVRFYASAPLVLPDGRVLGSLCVFSDQPGELGAEQRAALDDLAAQAVFLVEQARLGREATRQAALFRVVAEEAVEAQRALAVARDDAERRAALTGAVLETIDVGVVACDADGHLSLFNRAARDFHRMAEDPSLSPDDWAGSYDLYDEDGTTLLRPEQVPLLRALTDGVLRDASMVIAPPEVPARTVRCDGRAMHDGDGRLLGAVVAMKDVTQARARAQELVQARDEALAATRAKTAFLAAASHEIRTPLNGVLGTLELLSLQDLTDEQSAYVTTAHDSGRSLLRLLNDVLDLSKAEATSVVLTEEPLRPLSVARDVVAALQPVAARKGLQLRLSPGPDRLVRGDASRIRQVLMNLVGNAVKFTSDGSVTVAVDSAPAPEGRALVTLSVTDTGPGMPREELGRLFEPFVQGAQGHRYGGTGLGLALTRQVVDLMGGAVDVSSELGRGSRFTVVLDLADESGGPDEAGVTEPATPAQRSAPGGRPQGGAAGRLRVLVADDNDTNLLVAEAMLTALGADVVTVADGDEAVEAVRREAFDLVLLDGTMPRLSGPDAAKAIRALPGRAGRTRLLAHTASGADEDRHRFRTSGMDGVLVKPVQLADLQRALDALEP